MTETHSIRLLIDAAGAQKGATVYKNAIGQITTATVAYQKALQSMGTKKGSADFSKMARELGQLNGIRVNPNLSRSLNELSGVLKNFKGPSSGSLKGARDFLRVVGQAQVNNSLARNVGQISSALSGFRGPSAGAARNVQAFMAALGSARINPQTAAQLAAFTHALAGFRGPSKGAAANVTQLMSALSSARINPQTAGHLATFTAALGSFRGPSAAGVRNINGLIDGLNRLRNPPNISALAAALDRITTAAGNAGRAARNLGSAHTGAAAAARTYGQASLGLTGNMRGLENAMSVSYQLGSQLRVLFGSLTFAEFTKGVYNATLATQRFNTTLGVTAKGPGEVGQQFAYATAVADKFGLSLEGVYNEYGKFTTAAKLSGQTTENVQYIFEAMSGAMRVMGTDAQGQERVFRALTQIFSKGAVRAEELVQQLGEQIPGAFQMMQDALSDQLGRKVDLAKMLELGQVDDSAVVLLAQKIAETFEGQVGNAMQRADAQVGRLSNSWFKFQNLVGENGVQDAIGEVAKQLNEIMSGDAFQANAVKLAQGLGNAIRTIGDAAAWAMVHVKELSIGLVAFMTSSAITTIGRIAAGILTVGSAGTAVAGIFLGLPLVIGAATGALAYFWDEQVKIGNTTTTVSALVIQSFNDIKTVAVETFKDILNWATTAWDQIDNMSWDTLAKSLIDFDLKAATSFESISVNAKTGAQNTLTVWDRAFNLAGASAQGFGTKVTKSFLQLGTAAINYAKYQAKALVPGSDSDALWRDFIVTTKGSYDEIENAAAATNRKIIENWKVPEMDLKGGFTSILKPVVEDYADSANSAAFARELAVNRDAAAAATKRLQDAEKARDAAKLRAPDLSGLDPVKGGDKGDVGPQSKRMKAATKAMKDYQAELADLLVDFNAGAISLTEFNKGLDFQAKKLQETSDPYAAMVRSMQDEADVAGMATKAREVEIEYRSKINELAEKGAYLNDKQSAALRKMIEESQKLKDQPFRQWVDSIEEVGVATDKIAIKAVEGLSDEIADMVVTGKADFQSLAQSILKEFIKVGLNRLYKNIFDGFGGKDKADGPASLLGPQTKEGAQGFVVKEMFKDENLRGTFGSKLNPTLAAPEVEAMQAQIDAKNKFTSQFTEMRNSLDVEGNAFVDSAGKVKTFTIGVDSAKTNIDAMTTGAINAADALNRLATAANGGGTGASQPFPAMPGASGEMGKALPVTFKGADQKQLAASLSSRLQADFGLTDFQAAGAVGNLAHETQGFTKLQEMNPTSGRGGYGLAQWTGPRRTQFENFAKDQGKSMDDPETNYQFLKHELMTSEKNSIAALKKTTSLSEATRSFDTTFERSGVKNFASRDRYAEMAMGASKGTGFTPGGFAAVKGSEGVHPDLQAVVQNSKKYLPAGAEYQLGENGGLRTLEQQKKYLAEGRTTTLNSRHLSGTAMDLSLKGTNAADHSAYLPIRDAMKKSSQELGVPVEWGGDWKSFKDSPHWQLPRGYQSQGLDPNNPMARPMGMAGGADQINTSGIDQATEKLKVLGTTAQTTAQQAGQQVSASQQLVTAQQQASQGTQQAAQQFTQAGVQVGQSGVAATGAAPQFTQAGTAIQQAGQQAGQGAQAAGVGLGQLAGLAGSIPGAGPYAGMFQQVLGLFGMKEGGISDSPSGFQKMPHYKEGTPNTGTNGQGGIPSVLHPNEAVIPLTRGRKVGVDLGDGNNGGANVLDKGPSRMAPTFNVSIVTPDPGAFHKSKRQIETTMASAYQKSLQQDA